MDKGNKSDLYGDKSAIYEKVESMLNQYEVWSEQNKAAKEATDKKKEMLDKTSSDLLSVKPEEGWGKRKGIDGTVVDNRSSKKKAKDQDLGIAEWWNMGNNREQNQSKLDNSLNTLTAYAKDKGFTISTLIDLNTAKVKENLEEVLEGTELDLILSLYTGAQGLSNPTEVGKHFKKELTDMGVPVIASHKIYFELQKWEKDCESTGIKISGSIKHTPSTVNSFSVASSATSDSDLIDRLVCLM